MKLIKKIGMTALFAVMLCGCQNTSEKPEAKPYTYSCDASNKCNGTFMGPFDTQFQVIMYAESESQFEGYMDIIVDKFTYYNNLFDKYNDYEGLANVKTINDQAGKTSVNVDENLFNLIKDSLTYSNQYTDKVNIALGLVLEVWHEYRDKNDGSIPTLEELEEKNKNVDLSKIILNEQDKSVYLSDEGMSLDVGATAKGYACELVKQELIGKGVDNFLISAGGNIISYGQRKVRANATELSQYLPKCRDYYTIDIASPKDEAYENINAIMAIALDDGQSVVTSGDYQRYYIGNDGVRYHHLIDPDTLFPPLNFRSVTIIADDSGLADFLSSATFLLPFEEGKAMIEKIDDVEAIWLLNDGTIACTSGLIEGENCHFYAKVTE